MKIAIKGNIGIGKSTVIQRLSHATRVPIFLEPVDEWKDWLSLFYKDPVRWGFSFNVNVLLSFQQWKQNAFKAIYERSPMCCRYVFTQLQHDHHNLSDMEMELFDKIYQEMAWEPDVVIYLRASPQTCWDRMQARGRACESDVSLEYLTKVHDLYEAMIQTCQGKGQKVYVVDAEQTPDVVFEEVCSIIRNI